MYFRPTVSNNNTLNASASLFERDADVCSSPMEGTSECAEDNQPVGDVYQNGSLYREWLPSVSRTRALALLSSLFGPPRTRTGVRQARVSACASAGRYPESDSWVVWRCINYSTTTGHGSRRLPPPLHLASHRWRAAAFGTALGSSDLPSNRATFARRALSCLHRAGLFRLVGGWWRW